MKKSNLWQRFFKKLYPGKTFINIKQNLIPSGQSFAIKKEYLISINILTNSSSWILSKQNLG